MMNMNAALDAFSDGVRGHLRQDSMNTFGQSHDVSYASIEKKLKRNGTDTKLNRESLTGNGDQSELRDEKRADFHRALWSEGGNGIPLDGPKLSQEAERFAQAVLCGLLDVVEDSLLKYGKKIRVKLQNIKSEQSLNGKTGIRGCYIPEKDRYLILLEGTNPPRKLALRTASFTVIEELPPANPEKVTELLEHRWGVLRTPPLIMCITGAKSVQNPGGQWASIGHMLLDYGAKPDGRDLVGKTVVHYGCGGMLRTPHSDSIVREACKRMPDLINLQDRMGECALEHAVMIGDIENLQFMVNDLKADVTVRDFHGISPLSMAHMNPKVRNVLSAGSSKVHGDALKSQAKANCARSGCTNEGKLWCGKCLSVYYCGRECQKADWKKGHSKKCKDSRTDVIEIRRKETSLSMMSLNNENLNDWDGNPPGKKTINEEFIVKIQVTADGKIPSVVYDKKRILRMCFDETSCPRFEELKQLIVTKGVLGRKGYFRARVAKKGVLEVFHKKMMHTEESW